MATSDKIKKVVLDRFKYNIRCGMNDSFGVATELYIDHMIRNMYVTMVQGVYGETLEDFKLDVPINWWEHFKERFLSGFLKVKYKHYHYEARALYPKVSLPEKEHYVVTNLQGGCPAL